MHVAQVVIVALVALEAPLLMVANADEEQLDFSNHSSLLIVSSGTVYARRVLFFGQGDSKARFVKYAFNGVVPTEFSAR